MPPGLDAFSSTLAADDYLPAVGTSTLMGVLPVGLMGPETDAAEKPCQLASLNEHPSRLGSVPGLICMSGCCLAGAIGVALSERQSTPGLHIIGSS